MHQLPWQRQHLAEKIIGVRIPSLLAGLQAIFTV
jgi:hypothetical protein